MTPAGGDPEKMKLIEQLQAIVQQKLVELVRKFPDKNPEIVFVPYPSTWAANMTMKEIAEKENTGAVDFAKFTRLARPLLKNIQSSGQNFANDQQDQATTDLLVKTVLEDLISRKRNAQKEN
jgi:hypothetical protein